MIRCFKCDAPATQGPDGVIHMSCNCFPPHLARSGEAVYIATTPGSTTAAGNETYKPCPFCGQPVFRQDFHRCHGMGAIPGPAQPTPDGLKYCQNCGAPMLQPDHTCHKVKPPTEAAMKQAMLIDRDTLKFEHVKRLALFMIEHEKKCEKCLFFVERGSKVRCAEYLNMDKVCTKWQKRIEVQK